MTIPHIPIRFATIIGEPYFETKYLDRKSFSVIFSIPSNADYIWFDDDLSKLEKLYEYIGTDSIDGKCIRIIEVLNCIGFGHPKEDKFILAHEGFQCKEFTKQEFIRFIYDTFGR